MTLNRLAPEDAEAPPPYTPSDPLTPSSSNVSTTGESQQRTAAVEYVPLYSPSIAPANFISARGYFQERPPERQHQPDEEILEHALTIYTRSKAKDYHRFPRCWRSRSEEISKHDWKTFLNYLFPSRLGPASHRPDLPPKLRAELQRDQKDRAQESDEEGKSRIAAVVSEWNDFFFVPRGTAVIYCYGSEDGSASVSPLCPNCYPSSVRSMQPGQDATRSRATGTTSSQTLVDPSAPTPEAARNADTEPTTQPETQANSTNRDTSGGTPPLGLFAGAVNLVHNWAARKAQLAQMCGEQAGEWGMALGQHAHNRGLALGKHAELRGKVLGARAEALGKTLEQRADWVWQMALTDPWRFAGVHSCDDGTRERRYSTSSSSSSSESSDDDDDTISTLSTDSDWDQDDLAVLRSRIQSLRERHNEARNLVSQDSANVLRQKEELLAVRLAHHELRKCTRRRGRNRGPKISTAERKAVREELRGLKRDYRALRKQARSERIKVRKEERKRRKEERKVRKEARKAARKVNRRQMGRAQFGQWSRGGQCGRGENPQEIVLKHNR